jgi:hypothetical protein
MKTLFKRLISKISTLFLANSFQKLSFEEVTSWSLLLPQIIKAKGFNATFFKKDGSLRFMYCKFESTKYLDKGIVTVFDMQKGTFRSLNLYTLQNIQIGNVHYSLKKEMQ